MLVSALAGFGGMLAGRFMGLAQMTNGIFNNLVSVTGDAHQAQIAQDIFRADVRHELSLLIREDMRDVHSLMVETVSTQVTVGSIVLGACFSVLIEGYTGADGGPQWLLEMWSIFSSWAVLCTLTSLMLSMYFLDSIKSAVTERLLLRHRIFTPNDAVISSLGGYGLAEQVSRLHTRLVTQLCSMARLSPAEAEVATVPVADLEPQAKPPREAPKPVAQRTEPQHQPEILHTAGHAEPYAEPYEETHRPPRHWIPSNLAGERHTHLDYGKGSQPEGRGAFAKPGRAHDRLATEVQVTLPPCENCSQLGRSAEELHIACAQQGVEAWYDPATHALLNARITELPGFLCGSTLIRQPFVASHLEPLRLRVSQEATLYVAGRLPEPEPGGAARQNFKQALALDKVCEDWGLSDMPLAVKGMHPENLLFEKVDGYSVFVDGQLSYIPLYKLALRPPEAREEGVDVEVRWSFRRPVEALCVFVREGCVLSSEDDFPKIAFLQEVDVLWPHMAFARSFIQWGTSLLLLAVLCMQLVRLLPRRAFAVSFREVTAAVVAIAVALVGTWVPVPVEAPFSRSENEEGHRASADYRLPDAWSFSRSSGVKSAGPLAPSRSNGVASARLSRQRRRNLLALSGFAIVLGVIFSGCITWSAVENLQRFVTSSSATVSELELPPPEPWRDLSLSWPPWAVPRSAFLTADGIWVASAWQLWRAEGAGARPRRSSAPRWRLAVSSLSVARVGELWFLLGEDGFLRVVRDPGGAVPPDVEALRIPFSVSTMPLEGGPVVFPGEPGGRAVALAGSPEAGLWTGGDGPGPRILAVAFSASLDTAATSSVVVYALTRGPAAEQPRLVPLERLRAAEWFGGGSAELRALHLEASSSEGSSPLLWVAATGPDGGRLIAVDLDTSRAFSAVLPWPQASRRELVALSGNTTHIVAISTWTSALGLIEPQARVARYMDLQPSLHHLGEL